ncbi:hypothetical protein TI39_contig315g00018 [Zymoseptoria brevis]|uniref:Uncharacterized protein n=1 Tax=Zymoseptoria brevis TaxID=1047168 RepID=A0A0F4GTJ6_9PEZI|nr:hypothetical protein TI39_contig315g00018 [Zymoseptoria brevis]
MDELTGTIRSHARHSHLLTRRLTALQEGHSQLWDAICETHDKIEQAQIAENKTMERHVRRMFAKTRKLRQRMEDFDAKQEEVKSEMKVLDDALQTLRAELCSLLELNLTEQGLVKRAATPVEEVSQPRVALSLGVWLSTSDLGADCATTASETDSSSVNPSSDDSDDEELSPEQMREKEKDDQLLWARVAFEETGTAANKADAAFEARFDKFDAEIARHERKLAAGEEVEDIQEMYLRHFHETRRLTQEFAKAEEDYYKAKDAALAAGVDLREEGLGSGFLDYPDDGYRLSEAKEDAGPVDHIRIANWVETVSSHEIEIENQIEGEAAGVIEDWDAESIEMCDSRSMVAEGPERRRILKWEALLRSQGLGQRPSASLDAKSEGQKYTEEENAVHNVELFACLPFCRT